MDRGFIFIRHRYNRGCGFDCIYIRNKESFFDYCEVIISELLLHNRRGLSTHDKMYITKLYHLTAAVFNLQKQIYFKVYYQEKTQLSHFFTISKKFIIYTACTFMPCQLSY